MLSNRRLLSVICVSLLALGITSGTSRASVEMCGAHWGFSLKTMTDCDNIAALTPGNDTRVNLLLLLSDRHHSSMESTAPVVSPILEWRDFRDRFSAATKTDPAGFAAGEGSRCRSDEAGAAAFGAAVNGASNVSAEERASLVAARAGLKPKCSGESVSSEIVDNAVRTTTSKAGKAYAVYLRGVDAFYGGRFDAATADFESLKGSADAWIADTADYMAARTLVNALQVNAFDEYGTFKGTSSIDQHAASGTEARLTAYLQRHPEGRYRSSAAGLLRRVAWLAGWNDKLAEQYSALLAKPPSTRGIGDMALAEEIDSKLLPSLTPQMTRDPLLLAVIDLKAMRKSDKADAKSGRPDLEAQRDAFASAMPLFEFVTAASAFYGDGATAPVLKGLPDDTRRRDGDHLWFSRQFLRGQALEAAGDRNARGFWRELHPGATRPLDRLAVELALALNEERHGGVDRVFAANSLVTDPAMRAILLEHVAGPALLRAQAHDADVPSRERKVALFTLLYKQLTRAQYAEFLSDLRDVPADAAFTGSIAPAPEDVQDPPLGIFAKGPSVGDIACPALTTTVANLARNPEAIRDRLCLAEFVRVNEMDQSALDIAPADSELGSAPSTYPGTPYARAATYKSIIANNAASADDRAFAFYRAVRCYEPTGINGCGGADVPKAERKAWYNTLRREYPAPDGPRPFATGGSRVRRELACLVLALALQSRHRPVPDRRCAGLPVVLALGRRSAASRAGHRRAHLHPAGRGRGRFAASSGVPPVVHPERAPGRRVARHPHRDARLASGHLRPTRLRQITRWREAGNRVVGIQIDFDARTRHLAGYAAFPQRPAAASAARLQARHHRPARLEREW